MAFQAIEQVVEKLITGDFASYMQLYHSFAFQVDLQGEPNDDWRWQPKIITILNTHAVQGNGYCLTLLSNLYLYGWGGMAMQHSKAAELAKHSASLMNTYGEYQLGFLYLYGCGVVKDEARAWHWFNQAATAENPLAYNMLGYVYENGLAKRKKNLPEALKYYRKGAEQALSLSQYSLGRAYTEGMGTAKDPAMALQWHEQASRQGNALAQNALGLLHENGTGTPVDLIKAIGYFLRAARTYEPAQQNLERLRRNGHYALIEQAKAEIAIS